MSGSVVRRGSISLVSLGAILVLLLAAFVAHDTVSAASPRTPHVMTDACPGECYTYICGEPPSQHVFWDYPDSVSIDELDGGFHDECMAKTCCWYVEEPDPPNNCRHGECWSAPSPMAFLDELATSAEEGNVDRLDALLSENAALSLNSERSSIQLGSCNGRFKGNYPIEPAVAEELEQRQLKRQKPTDVLAIVQPTHFVRLHF
jgi:hypothetical protein